MKFNINTWNKYRIQANAIGAYITYHKDEKGFINMTKKELDECIDKITEILRLCSKYMNTFDMKMTKSLWEYNRECPTTHPSSKSFLYKHRMSKQAIRNYGNDFMAN